ncbi:prepilin peptidase [Pseudolysinimonas yzui]|uniref:Prepilin peptidase n=1 Tax=Pseudolysinimonas yzui TaxID=2708254 RepID=A0A8J3GRX7_9MICO|nr:A24 family peptidase [Pseudolysinimonas yzui]GHF20927.1 prepilin peptidase [Pseudolysinimonas yzui]
MVAVAVWAVFGSAVGSFLNVVIHRVPAGRSVVRPSSACGACGHEIRWYDNIPILSWLALRGRCRDCSAPISARYPLIELAGAAGFGIVAWAFFPGTGSTTQVVADWIVLGAFQVLAAASIALAAIDLETRRLPNVIVAPLAAVGAVAFLAAAVLAGNWSALLGALVGGLVLGGFYALPALVRPGSMGMGDVKLAGVLGLYLGWLGLETWLVGVVGGFLIAGIVGVALIAAGRRGTTVALGPWLLAGAWLGILAGHIIAAAYLGIFGLH